MAVAAMIDLGADKNVLMNVLSTVPVKGFEVRISEVSKSSIKACDFDVILEHNNHDHDMKYLHGHECHKEQHGHERNLSDVIDIIEKTQMTDNARVIAKKIFTIIAEAEANVHGKSIDKVHFHEVGALDSIIDIISFAVCFDNLGFEKVIVPVLCEGRGTIRCRHGILPVPVPATTEIVKKHFLRLKITDVEGELVTPTGAGIVAGIVTDFEEPSDFIVTSVGIGAGKREYKTPGIVRAMEIEIPEYEDSIIILETNIDDCSGEAMAFTMECLFNAGARDVYFTPVFMKKNRPAYKLTVACTDDNVSKMENIIFKETTTIGIRRSRMIRTVLSRENVVIETTYGPVEVKICDTPEGKVPYPEYSSISEICRRTGEPYGKIYEAVKSQCSVKI